MNAFAWIYLIGALAVTGVLLLVLACVLIVLVHWRESRLWRRFARTCGGDKQARHVLEAAEALDVEHYERRAHQGFKLAQRRGLLKGLTP